MFFSIGMGFIKCILLPLEVQTNPFILLAVHKVPFIALCGGKKLHFLTPPEKNRLQDGKIIVSTRGT